MIYNQFLLKEMPFDPVHGLQPITDLFDLIHVLVVNSDLKVRNVDELVALSKAKPGTLSYLTPGASMVLYMETLKKERGADWVRVPFKGGGEAVNAILSGSTPIGLFGEGNVIGQIKAGTMTPLVMMNNIHSPNFPQVPTLKETGYDGPPSRGWYGLFAPVGTPRPIVDRIAKETAAIVADPEFTAAAADRPEPGRCHRYAGRICPAHRRGPQSGRRRGEKRRPDPGVTVARSLWITGTNRAALAGGVRHPIFAPGPR